MLSSGYFEIGFLFIKLLLVMLQKSLWVTSQPMIKSKYLDKHMSELFYVEQPNLLYEADHLYFLCVRNMKFWTFHFV